MQLFMVRKILDAASMVGLLVALVYMAMVLAVKVFVGIPRLAWEYMAKFLELARQFRDTQVALLLMVDISRPMKPSRLDSMQRVASMGFLLLEPA